MNITIIILAYDHTATELPSSDTRCYIIFCACYHFLCELVNKTVHPNIEINCIYHQDSDCSFIGVKSFPLIRCRCKKTSLTLYT